MDTVTRGLKIGAALVGALGLIALALAVHVSFPAAMVGLGGLGLAGTVAYNYVDPGSGTVPATVTQAQRRNSQTAEIGFADGDTIATFTHNWALATAQNTLDRPWVIAWAKNVGTAAPNLTFALNTNTVTATKAAASGSANTTVVTLLRPHSIIR